MRRALTQRGIALVAVMWLVSALALIVAGIAANARSDVRSTHLATLFAEHAALGDAAIRLGAVTMLGHHPLHTPFTTDIVFDGHALRVEALPAAAFIDLNHAPDALLYDLLLHGAALEPARARILAERIANWRDPHRPRLPHGADATDYAAAGSPFRPRNGGFDAPADLLQVLGITFEIYERVAPLVTVHNPDGGIDPRFATADVLRILTAGDMALVAHLIERRSQDALTELPPHIDRAHLARHTGGTYRIRAYREVDDRVLVRERWISLDQPGPAGTPWRELASSPVSTLPRPERT